MHQADMPNASSRPRVTVAALVERDGRFLFVEEQDKQGRLVINQPAGHVEGGESLLAAVVRETYEETGWRIRPMHLVGVYLWAPPNRAISYLRIAIAGDGLEHDPAATLDAGIVQALWLTPAELAAARARHRSDLVSRCVEDYRSGTRYPLDVLKSLLV
jgi:8-oxo-dGTP pyrophosphatase MutT (NUDIX family)